MSEHARPFIGDGQARDMAEAVARRSYGKLVAFLAARTRDVAAAEDALSEAFVAALADWPRNGCPSNPEAWLLTAARRKMIDIARRRRHEEMAIEQLQLLAEGWDEARADADIPDHRLALMFACAHPGIEAAIRAPLILQVLLGLEEAIYLGSLVTQLMPEEPEALGLLALMFHAEARRPARRNEQGEYVPLVEQDTSLWDSRMIDAAEGLLLRASTLGDVGRYQLEGALQSAHVYRRRTGQANWPAVVQLYDALLTLSGSPVVAINRSLALAEMQGADAALHAMEEIAADSRLIDYQPYWAARAQLLVKIGANSEACHSYEIAIGLERDTAVRRFLQRRQSALLP